MRFSPILLVSSIATSVHAFYPYEIKISATVGAPSEEKVIPRFFPWRLVEQASADDASPPQPFTLGIKKGPARRGDTYAIVKSNTPTMKNSAALDQDGEDFSYFAVVDVGSQKQQMWMALDTGSPSSWVFSALCRDSVCQRHHKFDKSQSSSYSSSDSVFTIGYGSGTVSGNLGTDTFGLADMDVTLSFGTATSANDTFASYPFDGILGLGRSRTGGWGIPSFMDVVADKKLLPANIVGFSLSRAKDHKNDGEVNFGAVDTTKFDGNISYIPTSTKTWTIPMDDAYVDGKPLGLTNRAATIDTGTTYILIPPADAAALFAHVPNSYRSGENFIIPCNSTATIEFAFAGIKYSILPEDYIGASSTGGCVATIVGHESSGPNDWLVGDVFLKNVYSVFDFDNGHIGFGALASPNSTGNGTAVIPTATASAGAAMTTVAGAPSRPPSNTSAAATSTIDTVMHTGAATRITHSVGFSFIATLTGILFI
ncbi:Aspartic-type endopeptidase ctsD [Penicillium diatomitis]|uniref:penicillopepsin n=1 Tax=Penicillium diatomitis TaxID=2819901 RepID=A0A9W9X6H8_9EURO|nr:Aspartic-type endopeptidase ctsD [Penicillium diatomitis]KAJ5484986.1 Aspartic-type endopeptidase ctsD [Penicillium diatomitis]